MLVSVRELLVRAGGQDMARSGCWGLRVDPSALPTPNQCHRAPAAPGFTRSATLRPPIMAGWPKQGFLPWKGIGPLEGTDLRDWPQGEPLQQNYPAPLCEGTLRFNEALKVSGRTCTLHRVTRSPRYWRDLARRRRSARRSGLDAGLEPDQGRPACRCFGGVADGAAFIVELAPVSHQARSAQDGRGRPRFRVRGISRAAEAACCRCAASRGRRLPVLQARRRSFAALRRFAPDFLEAMLAIAELAQVSTSSGRPTTCRPVPRRQRVSAAARSVRLQRRITFIHRA